MEHIERVANGLAEADKCLREASDRMQQMIDGLDRWMEEAVKRLTDFAQE